jgi:hypothetical protein
MEVKPQDIIIQSIYMDVETDGSCHILMLVDGTSVIVKPINGAETIYHYAETLVMPAAAKSYTLINKGTARANVVKAF